MINMTVSCIIGKHDDEIINEITFPAPYKALELKEIPKDISEQLIANLVQETHVKVYKCTCCKRIKESIIKTCVLE